MTETSSGSAVLAGRYRLFERIGSGAMAEVFRAEDVVLERPVAVKMLHPGIDQGARDRLRHEVRLLAQLSHPGLVAVYDAGDHDGRGFLVMQLVTGGTLGDRLATGPLASDEVRRVGLRLADVVAYLHGRGLVHRDLKPSNVLLQPSGEVLLADFGIARMLDAAHQTATGSTIGTAAFMAPEQLQERPVGPAADVYALGLLLIQALTGEPVYSGGSSLEVAAARLHRPPTVPRASSGASLADLLEAMTRVEPADRPSASEVVHRLRAMGSDTVAADGTGPAGADTTAVLPVTTEESVLGHEQPSVEANAHGLRAVWQHRTTPVLGVRADLVVLVGVVVLGLLVLILMAAAQTQNPVSERTDPGGPRPAQPAGPERLPSDLDRLEKAVRP